MTTTQTKTARRVAPVLKLVLAAALATLPLAFACSSSPEAEPAGAVGEPIINGQHDPGHPAVVRLFLQRSNGAASCTGTIVRTDPATKVGWILTAGHCVRDTTNVIILQGEDTSVASGLTRYAFLDLKAHPNYDGATSSPYDVAMIRFLGASATTPVMPILSPDTMTSGTPVLAVGFGKTSESSSAPPNSGKNRIAGRIAGLSTTRVDFSAPNGSTCNGDSGGPLIVTVNGQERVGGTLSFGSQGCFGTSSYVRTSAHTAFVNSILGEAAPAPSCDVCKRTVASGDEVCAKARTACTGDPQCDGLRKCISACSADAADAGSDAGPSDDCKKACAVQFPFGAAPYNTEVIFCPCRECGSKCAGDTTCAALPKCGMKLGDDTCTSCVEGSCCAQAQHCGADGHCYRCTKNPETAGCATDAKYQALQTCRATSCASACPAAPASPAEATLSPDQTLPNDQTLPAAPQ